MSTTINMAQQYEHIRTEAPALAHMHVAAPFMEELDTPEAEAFVEKFREKFPDDDYVGMEAEAQYTGVYLRSEEYTSELQSRGHLVCRLLLEKKKNKKTTTETR